MYIDGPDYGQEGLDHCVHLLAKLEELKNVKLPEAKETVTKHLAELEEEKRQDEQLVKAGGKSAKDGGAPHDV
jgi:uncharacterized protein YciI